jgi:hypothetical protein
MKPTYTWNIRAPIRFTDIDIINNIANDPEVEYEIIDPTVTGIDSGWCDASTGHRLVTSTMSIDLTFTDEKYSTLIRLKFGDRAYLKSISLEAGPCVLGT